MSPLTAVLKYLHDEGGYISNERGGEGGRRHLLQMALDGWFTVNDAGGLMGMSCQHAKRLRRRYDLDGA